MRSAASERGVDGPGRAAGGTRDARVIVVGENDMIAGSPAGLDLIPEPNSSSSRDAIICSTATGFQGPPPGILARRP
jgi:hypothetical protein